MQSMRRDQEIVSDVDIINQWKDSNTKSTNIVERFNTASQGILLANQVKLFIIFLSPENVYYSVLLHTWDRFVS